MYFGVSLWRFRVEQKVGVVGVVGVVVPCSLAMMPITDKVKDRARKDNGETR